MISTSDVFLPVTFNRQSAWLGHRPGTRIRLRTILDQAALRSDGLNLAERALCAACEFWSAAATQSLARHLGSNPELRLRSLAAIYLAMGAKRAARAIELARVELPLARNEVHRQQRIAALEVMLFRMRTPVEDLIGRFAVRLMPRTLASVPVPAVIASMPSAALARRPVNGGLRLRVPVAGVRRPARTYVRWRTENLGAGQQD